MATDRALERYIERIRKIPVLDRETEHELAVRARQGDEAAREALVRANLRYVVSVALQYRAYGVRLADLLAEGNLGLVVASHKFDPDRGTRFVTYAGYWIRAFVLDAVVKSTTMVGGGTGPLRSKLFFRLRRERARLGTLLGDDAERLQEMARRFGVSPERMREMLRRVDARDVSLDQKRFDDGEGTLLDLLPAEGPDPETAAMEAERREVVSSALREALRTLDERERFIVERRLLDDEPWSLAALGRQLGVSRERARQLEARAKKKMRRHFERYEALLDQVSARQAA